MKDYISRTRVNLLISVLERRAAYEKMCFDFCLKNDLFSEEDKLEIEVNWSAIGSVSAEEALQFANALKRGAELAAAINGLNLYYKWHSKDTVVTDSESYAREYEKLERMYESNPISVVDWVLDSIGAVQG